MSVAPLTRRTLDYQDVLGALNKKGIAIRVASPKLVMEEVSRFGDMPECSTTFVHSMCIVHGCMCTLLQYRCPVEIYGFVVMR